MTIINTLNLSLVLAFILCFLQSFMMCHDQIALKNFMPVLPDIPHEVDEDDDATVKVIRLVKSPSEPLVIFIISRLFQVQLNVKIFL